MTVCSAGGRVRLVWAALLSMVLLAGCETDGTSVARHLKPLSPEMVSELEKKNMPKESPMVVRIFKEEAELEVWKADVTGHFALLKTYPICRWSGELGPKVREGDRQAPEGFYTITPAQMNPNSHYYLSFNIGYPNAFDRAYGRTGSELMVHGDCSSRGCYAMTDEQISEIYALARESFFGGQRSFQVQAYPFRMTALNMARHANNPNMPFWNMLKEGSDHFEVSRLEPKVDVCEKRYVFDAEGPADGPPLNFNPTGRCPAYQVPAEIANEVAEKTHRDQAQTAELVSHGIAMAPVRTGTDGGMNKVFLARLRPPTGPDGSDRILPDVHMPGTIPANVNPPGPPDPAVEAASSPPAAPVKTAQAASPSSPPGGGGNSIAGLFGLASTESRPVPAPPPAASARPPTTSANRSDDTNPITRFLASDSSSPAPRPSPASSSTSSTPPSSSTSSDAGLSRVTSSVSKLLGLGSEDKKPTPTPPTPPRPPHVAAAPPAPPSRPPALNIPAPPTVPSPPPAHANPVASTRPDPVRQPANPNDQPPSSPTQSVTSASAATNTLNGAQPVLPAGSFDSRWGAIR